MATSKHGRRATRTQLLLLISTMVVLALDFHPASAQSIVYQYNNVTGYQCEGVQTCTAYVYYRTQGSNSTLTSVAVLFNTTSSAINASSLNSTTATTPLPDATPLLIPLSCGCNNGTYQAPVTTVVMSGDTMYYIANNTYEGLVTFQAIQLANPSIVPTDMQLGAKLTVPLRCACPSTTEMTAGTKNFLSYAVYPNEDLNIISNKFDVSELVVQSLNSLPNATAVEAFTTVLVPLQANGTGSNATAPAPSSSAASRGFEAHLLGVLSLLAAQAFIF